MKNTQHAGSECPPTCTDTRPPLSKPSKVYLSFFKPDYCLGTVIIKQKMTDMLHPSNVMLQLALKYVTVNLKDVQNNVLLNACVIVLMMPVKEIELIVYVVEMGKVVPGPKTTGTAHVYHVVILMTMCVYSRILMFNVILKKQTLRIYIKFIAYHSIEILNRTHTENIRIFKSI